MSNLFYITYRVRKVLLVSLLFILVFSCKTEKKHIYTEQQLPLSFELVRFEQLFNAVDQSSFKTFHQRYAMFFPGDFPDKYWLTYRQDTLYQELYNRVREQYTNFDKETQEINGLFSRLKKVYPNFKAPKVITLISNLDLNNQVIYADSLLLISLDNYLGTTSDVYTSFPKYIKQFLRPERIPVDIAAALVNKTYSRTQNPVFVERMIDAGKEKYAISTLLPEYTEATIINYTPSQLEWAKENEFNIWHYFIEKDYLFDADKNLAKRFLEPAPFSKFYLQNDIESPGQISVWMGWQIVKSYVEKHSTTLPELLATPSKEIYNQSSYKPKKIWQ